MSDKDLTPDWVADQGLQIPTRFIRSFESLDTNHLPTISSPTSTVLTLDNLQTIGALLGVLDREAQTLDVSRQAAGPRWNLRQWSDYWKERKASARMRVGGQNIGYQGEVLGGGLAEQKAGLNPPGSTMMDRAASEAAAARGLSSSSVGDGLDGGEMDDEADSAWVHGKG